MNRHDEAGFTLVETIVALVLFALISLAGVRLIESVLGIQQRTDGRLERLAEAQRAMFTIDTDLRALESGPRIEGAALRFERHDRAGIRTISYEVVEQSLRRTINGQTQILLDGVTAAEWRFHRPRMGWAAMAETKAAGRPDAVSVLLRLTGAPERTLRHVIALPDAP